MKVVVIGSTGFLGSYICSKLKQKHVVIGTGTRKEYNGQASQYIQSNMEMSSFVEHMSNIIGYCDVIVHAAACLDKDNFSDKLIDINCKGTNHVVQLAKEVNCKQLIHCSGLPVVGKPMQLPITEEITPKPNTLYHITKLTSEYIVNQSSSYNIRPVNLRIPSPVGVGMNEKTILPVLLKQCLENKPITIYGNGLRKQNYIDVRDIAGAVEKCIEYEVQGTFNIASETIISNIDLARLCIEITQSNSEITFNNQDDLEDKDSWEISTQKASQAFGFQTQYTLIDTIKNILKHWKKSRIL